MQKPTQELAVGLSFSRQSSQTELGIDNIGPFRLSPDADENGKTNISAVRFFQEYTQRSNQYVFAARSQLSFGVDWFDANVSENELDSRFFAWLVLFTALFPILRRSFQNYTVLGNLKCKV
ncbi:hypothetical protein [Nostoc sp. TCL240-02]|uniref:hypothetical protein n=1 Tax=Nostoc sp. TCL240-02 TaxID=2572090 RepID=UPI0034A04864